MDSIKKKLILETGDIFYGKGFGAQRNTLGEVVFHTGATGYQEIITNPAYCGQIVCMTYPLIGNYGINRDDYEGIRSNIGGLIVKEICDFPSNFRSEMTLNEFFKANNLSGIYDIDTRKLTKIIRDKGILKGKITDADTDEQTVINELKNSSVKNQVEQTSTKNAYINPNKGTRIVVLDLGTKLSIIRELAERDCHTTIVPHDTTFAEILALKPDGVVISSGGGSPSDIPHAVETTKHLLGKLPILGINLGHLVFGLASGAKLSQLKAGHHGGTPVLDVNTKKVLITDQNHSYILDTESLKHTDLEETFIALNDGTNQGIRHKTLPCFSVQFHPESKEGKFIFDEFLTLINK